MSGGDLWVGIGPEWDPESDPLHDRQDHRTVAQIRRSRAEYEARVGCFVEGFPNKTTVKGILCMSHLIDGFVFKGGQHG